MRDGSGSVVPIHGVRSCHGMASLSVEWWSSSRLVVESDQLATLGSF